MVKILIGGGNVYVISSMPGFLERSYFCEKCNSPYEHDTDHNKSCSSRCRYCFGGTGTCIKERWLTCSSCRRTFPSQACYDNHLKQPEGPSNMDNCLSVCQRIQICTGCGRAIPLRKKHMCGFFKCGVCKTWTTNENPHTCFITPIVERKKFDLKVFIIYDMEVLLFSDFTFPSHQVFLTTIP